MSCARDIPDSEMCGLSSRSADKGRPIPRPIILSNIRDKEVISNGRALERVVVCIRALSHDGPLQLHERDVLADQTNSVLPCGDLRPLILRQELT